MYATANCEDCAARMDGSCNLNCSAEDKLYAPHWVSDEQYEFYFPNAPPVRVSAEQSNPIVMNNIGMYFFYDEVWVSLKGPYRSEEECKTGLNEYANSL